MHLVYLAKSIIILLIIGMLNRQNSHDHSIKHICYMHRQVLAITLHQLYVELFQVHV